MYAGITPAAYAALPSELASLPQWVLWRGRLDQQADGTVRYNKIPIDPQSLLNADTTNPLTWSDPETAYAALPVALEEWEGQPGYWGGGIGFVFTARDPYVGIDFDHCVDAAGALDPHMQAWVERLASYTEVTPSGTGLHVIVRGTLPKEHRKKSGIELYETGRFFTMTGDHLPGTPQGIQSAQGALDALWCSLFGAQAGQAVWLLDESQAIVSPHPYAITRVITGPDGVPYAFFQETTTGWPLVRCEVATQTPTTTTPAMTDTEVLRRAINASNGAKVKKLYNGHWQQDYASQSEADLALCILFAFWTRDESQLARLMESSALTDRAKWTRRDGVGTYGSRTIGQALARQQVFFTGMPTAE